jgi:teichuronic acid biosynthesis glycosyltransferase TuaC
MKILFVSSGNIKHTDVSPFIKAQGQSLKDLGYEVYYFPIKGKGLAGYLKNVRPLGRFILDEDFDVVHAHYSLSGVVARLACRTLQRPQKKKSENKRSTRPAVIVSLLGSDVNSKAFRRLLLRLISGIWDAIIVKSDEMKKNLALKWAVVIPNGVNLNAFKPLNSSSCRAELGLDPFTNYILFAANPKREVKNFPLAKAAYSQLSTLNSQLTTDNCQLITLGTVPHSQIPYYLNACNVLILTSLWEGSPNIVKEAMACNVPIVSTKVGDVSWLFGDLDGHFLADPNPEDIAAKLSTALSFEGRTQGRGRLIELGLDAESVARRIVGVYEKVMERGRDVEMEGQRDGERER